MYIPTQINQYMPGPFLAMWSACVNSHGGGGWIMTMLHTHVAFNDRF